VGAAGAAAGVATGVAAAGWVGAAAGAGVFDADFLQPAKIKLATQRKVASLIALGIGNVDISTCFQEKWDFAKGRPHRKAPVFNPSNFRVGNLNELLFGTSQLPRYYQISQSHRILINLPNVWAYRHFAQPLFALQERISRELACGAGRGVLFGERPNVHDREQNRYRGCDAEATPERARFADWFT
jgi:hypothetical protein